MDTEIKQKQIGEQKTAKTRELFLSTLVNTGCHPKVFDDGQMEIQYDDASLIVKVHEEDEYLSVFFYDMYSVSIFDNEEVTRVKAQCNRVNASGYAKAIWNYRDDDCLYVGAWASFVFTEDIPYLMDYLCYYLDIIMDIKKAFVDNSDKEYGNS